MQIGSNLVWINYIAERPRGTNRLRREWMFVPRGKEGG